MNSDDQPELTRFEREVLDGFVEKLRNDKDAADAFVRSVVTSCLQYGHSRDIATLRALARDVALTAEFVADANHEQLVRPRAAPGGSRSLHEVFDTLAR